MMRDFFMEKIRDFSSAVYVVEYCLIIFSVVEFNFLIFFEIMLAFSLIKSL